MKNSNPFHLAIPVNNIDKCRDFYQKVLGCSEGRSDEKWVDFDFFGHQLVIHQVSNPSNNIIDSNPVDGHQVPIPHFGVILKWQQWHDLSDKLRLHKIDFIIEPYIRFEGEVGEQATMFFLDPSGNALEFKSFKNENQLFEK